MSKQVSDIKEKIQKTQRKLIKACLDHNENKMFKHRQKLIKLWIKAKEG